MKKTLTTVPLTSPALCPSRRESFLPFVSPLIGEEEIAEVIDTLRSGWLTTGPKTRRFEEQFREYVGARHAIAVNSCTSALHLALTVLGVGRGDEVIVPTFTFCATANVVAHLGARPVLVDVDQDFNVKPEAIEAAITPRTKAIMPVHLSGQACDLEAILAIAARHHLPVVEDAAHAVGATYRGKKIGTFGKITAFSFYATKNLTAGEGGMITTDDDQLAQRMRLLSLHGMNCDAWNRHSASGSWYYEVTEAGFKNNMSDLQASLGIHQLRKLDAFIATRTNYAQRFTAAFSAIPEIEPPVIHPHRQHAWHLYILRLKLERLRIDRAQFIEELRSRQIGTSVHFIPVHLQPFYQQTFGYRRGDFPNAEHLYERIISLPLYPPND